MTQLKACFDDVESKDAADVARCYLAFLKDWTSSEGFYGCLFINTCAEYSDTQSSPHKIAHQYKTDIRQWLFAEFKKVNTKDAKQKSDMLFMFGEGFIVAAQTGQESLTLDTEFLYGIDQIASALDSGLERYTMIMVIKDEELDKSLIEHSCRGSQSGADTQKNY